RQRPEDALRAQVFALFWRDVFARRQIVAAAEMPVAGTSQDRATDVAILPQIDPGGRDLVRGLLVEDVGLGRIVQRDVGDAVALLVIDRQIPLPRSPGARRQPSLSPRGVTRKPSASGDPHSRWFRRNALRFSAL